MTDTQTSSHNAIIGTVLLAAGRAQRFGSDKRQWRLPSGTRLVEHCARLYVNAGLPVVLVTDSSPAIITDSALLASVDVIHCEDAAQGMAHSLAAGIAYAEIHGWDACLVALADMPFIQASTISEVAQLSDAQRIVVPVLAASLKEHDDVTWGHPVSFGRQFFSAMCGLGGDRGARKLIRQHLDSVCEVPVQDEGIYQDIDQADDLAKYRELIKKL